MAIRAIKTTKVFRFRHAIIKGDVPYLESCQAQSCQAHVLRHDGLVKEQCGNASRAHEDGPQQQRPKETGESDLHVDYRLAPLTLGFLPQSVQLSGVAHRAKSCQYWWNRLYFRIRGSILGSVPNILLPAAMMVRSEDVKRAMFWEAGADLGRGFVNEPQDKAEHDTLAIQMKDPETKYNDITGPHALRIADELDKAGVSVSRRHKK